MGSPLSLHVNPEKAALLVTVINTESARLRLWARTCSWGWSIFSLLLAAQSHPVDWQEYGVKPVRWTRNVPRVVEIPAHGRFTYTLKSDDTQWQGLDASAPLLKKPLQMRVRLRIPQTSEAGSQNVFVGEAISAICKSSPPYGWLGSG